MKKVKVLLSACILLTVFMVESVFAVPGQTNEELAEYKAKTDQINQEMKQVRDAYKQDMRAINKDFADNFKKLDKDDKAGRAALLAKKREAKKQRQLTYRKGQTALREQVMAIQKTRQGARMDKVASDKAAKKTARSDKKAMKGKK